MSDTLRSELEEALRFLNHTLVERRLESADVAATLTALVQTLVAHGVLPPAEYERRRQRALDAQKLLLEEEPPAVKLGEAVDKYAVKMSEIDCASIIPICKARCCTLTVFCSAQDLDERVVQWDYSRPYRLRKRDDGYCVHSEPDTRRCGIYERRPAICRTYDCRDDKRIWRDFDKRILADPR
ncbi:MAG TPA: YkgJ family cysteine cluster protein [Polyangia bacterium]|nr:YkgJ family cysteine cluster protein [Polyangia bacterium]